MPCDVRFDRQRTFPDEIDPVFDGAGLGGPDLSPGHVHDLGRDALCVGPDRVVVLYKIFKTPAAGMDAGGGDLFRFRALDKR